MTKETWNTLLGVISFILFPAAFIFMFYSAGMLILQGRWEQFLLSVLIFVFVLAIDLAVSCIIEW